MIFGVRAKKVLDFLQKNWQEWNILKKKQFCKNETIFWLFQILSKKLWEIARKLLAAFPKLKITYPGVKFHHNSWCSRTRFVKFWLLQRFFGRFFEIAFFERWGSFWQKKSSFEQRSVFLMNFGVRAKTSRFLAKNTSKIAKSLSD